MMRSLNTPSLTYFHFYKRYTGDKPMAFKTINKLLFAAALSFQAVQAFAAYPDKPVKIIVPYPPGGTTDIIGRMIAQELQTHTGQTFIVENKPGAGGNIGATMVARSPSDGYTLLLVASGIFSINPTLYKDAGFDPKTSFAPVGNIATLPNLLIVNATNKHNIGNFADFLALGKKLEPNTLTIGSTGNGSALHLIGTVLGKETGISLTHVPYKGSAPMLQGVYSNDVDLAVDNLPTSIGHINAGKVKALAITSAERSPLLPDVPTAKEIGIPALDLPVWFGLVAPAGTDKEVVSILNAGINTRLADPEFKEKLKAGGMAPAPTTPQQFGDFIASEGSRWGKMVKESGATID
jgi:tripartite-type tricarboxylate transporter receptor subunit TctC